MSQDLIELITKIFLLILFLTAVASLSANFGLFGLDSNSDFAKKSMIAILFEIAGGVIWAWKNGLLLPATISTAIRFPENIDPRSIRLDPSACVWERRDMKANKKTSGRLHVVWGFGGWECKIMTPKHLDESITLMLKEQNGSEWEVRPFFPLSRTVDADPKR